MSALSAAASDEDGDTIRALRAAIEQARNWIAEHPDRRPISAGRMVAILTNALAAAPQPPVAEQRQYPLPDDLYGGSKDWRAGSYHERVEWLHLGYESAKKLIAELEQPQPVDEKPVAWIFQHDETGWITYVDAQKVKTGFEKGNPRWQKICPVYLNPQPPRQPLTDEQIAYCIFEARLGAEGAFKRNGSSSYRIARAIERAHGITGENT